MLRDEDLPAKLDEAQRRFEETAERIRAECDRIKKLLLAKNRAYGNSALDPLRIFSRADAIEQLRVRIDDKLSRLSRGAWEQGNRGNEEDTALDLIGYLVLLRVAEKREEESHHEDTKGTKEEGAEGEGTGAEETNHEGGLRVIRPDAWYRVCSECGHVEPVSGPVKRCPFCSSQPHMGTIWGEDLIERKGAEAQRHKKEG